MLIISSTFLGARQPCGYCVGACPRSYIVIALLFKPRILSRTLARVWFVANLALCLFSCLCGHVSWNMALDARSVQAHALLEEIGDARASRVAALDERRKSLKREQADISREIKNEQKKRQRLLEKARGLNDVDLVSVIAARAAAKAKAKAKARSDFSVS